jgi:lipopolysaccharide/colanic/teichoic acid biosynthesis glycosyltransferase
MTTLKDGYIVDGMNELERNVKRLIDLFTALICLVVFSPLMLACYIAVKHDPRYTYLYQVRPGITSYATLYNGYTDTIEKMLRRLELDLHYLEHRSCGSTSSS